MSTPAVDPAFYSGQYIFGYSLPGLSYFGNVKWYPQRGIFGEGAFGAQIPGKNQSDDMFAFRFGSYAAKNPYYEKGVWRQNVRAWPFTPFLSIRQRGLWAKRAC